jgi:hypothetical protein
MLRNFELCRLSVVKAQKLAVVTVADYLLTICS